MSRGGQRKGAGRKTLPANIKKQPCSLKLPGWLITWLDLQDESRAELIESALTKIHNLKEPPT